MLLNLFRFFEAQNSEPPKSTNLIADRFANVSLTDQFGHEWKFRDIYAGGRSIVINTMFTVCRGTCPGTSEQVKALRENLSPSFGKSLVFVSITLDPETDTPQMLRRYAHIYGAGEQEKRLSDWLFLTGKPEDIEALRRSLGFFDLNRRVDADVTQHAALLLFGNPAKDRWAALPSSLRIPLLVETIRRFCGFSFEQRYGIPG